MKKIMFLLSGGLFLAIINIGCQEGKPMDDDTIRAKSDSIYQARMVAVIDSMNKDCEANTAAWVQMKADSIYQAQSSAMGMK